MIIVCWRFDIERVAECSGAVQRNPMITNSITVQLLFKYIVISLFRVAYDL